MTQQNTVLRTDSVPGARYHCRLGKTESCENVTTLGGGALSPSDGINGTTSEGLKIRTLSTARFNVHKFYVLPTQCVYVFCVDLRTNSDYFPIQH
jgi:hypothetical protein